MKSKGFLRLLNRINYFDIDLEIVSMLILNQEKLAGANKIFENINKESFPNLYQRKNTAGSRKIILEHLRNSIYVSYIKDIYEEFTEYMQYLLKCASKNKNLNVKRFIGNNKIEIRADDLIMDGDWNKIANRISMILFKQLENERSTLKLVKTVNDKLALNIDSKIINEALPYLEIRHSFVHQNGEVNEDFKSKYPNLEYKGKKIQLSADLIRSAKGRILDLSQEFDNKMIANHLFLKTELQK